MTATTRTDYITAHTNAALERYDRSLRIIRDLWMLGLPRHPPVARDRGLSGGRADAARGIRRAPMSRRVMAFGVPCHDGEEWTCMGCERVQCNRCDAIDNGSGLCWSCHDEEDPETAA